MNDIKQIGLLDHRLDNFHSSTFVSAIHGPLAERGWRVVTACSGDDPAAGRSWCDERGISWREEIDRSLSEQVDAWMILAPSTPEVHLSLFERAASFGRPVWVDKPFADSPSQARRIFDLARESGIAVQGSSALRYSNVQQRVQEIGRDRLRHMITWGPGRSIEEYAIHPVEMAVSCMGPDVEHVEARRSDGFGQLRIDFSGGRTAVVNVASGTNTPYAAALTTAETTKYVPVKVEDIFISTAASILDFFESGEAHIDSAETIACVELVDALIQ